MLGTKEDGSPWKIGGPGSPESPKDHRDLAVKDGTAIATSGDYQRYYEVDGKRYHHILDPRTGWPAWHARSVTVVTRSAFWADYYSTLLFVLPEDQAMAWWRTIPIWKCSMWTWTGTPTCLPV